MAFPSVLKLEDFFFQLEQELGRHERKKATKSEKFGALSTPYLAKSILEAGSFFGDILPCPFHYEVDTSLEHCSLALLRNRAFVLMDRLCDVSYMIRPRIDHR